MDGGLDFTGRYILLLAEGAAEREVIDTFLESGQLLFSRFDLVGKKVQDRTSVRHVEDNFLSLKYEKKVSIVRIIDSRNEKFRLRAEYRDRYNEIITINTRPEIEILLIIKNGDYDDYCKVRSQEKASSYCRRKYGYRRTGIDSWIS